MRYTRTLWALIAALALAKGAGAAEVEKQAEPPGPGSCSGVAGPGLFDGPVALGFFSADFGTARRACPRSEVGLGLLAGATIDNPDFYGTLSGGALLYGSYTLSPALEVFGALEAVKLQYVQNASLKGTTAALGQATVGASYTLLRQGRWLVAPSGRVMLPTDFSMPNVRTVGLELGGAASYQVNGNLELHGYLGGDLSAGLSAAGALPRPGLLASAGVQYAFASWIGVALDLDAHAGDSAYLAPALALRVALARAVGLEVGGTLPLLGTIRSNGALGVKVACRL